MKFATVLENMEQVCGSTIKDAEKETLANWLDNALKFAGIGNLTDEQLSVFSRAMRNAYWRGQENR